MTPRSGSKRSRMAGAEAGDIVALDANFLVKALIEQTAPNVRLTQWVRKGCAMQISAVAWSEYMCGPLDDDTLPVARKLVGAVESFTAEDAELAAFLFNGGGRRSRSRADCMIAAHAIRREAALATLNAQDFRRFEKFGLRLA